MIQLPKCTNTRTDVAAINFLLQRAERCVLCCQVINSNEDKQKSIPRNLSTFIYSYIFESSNMAKLPSGVFGGEESLMHGRLKTHVDV